MRNWLSSPGKSMGGRSKDREGKKLRERGSVGLPLLGTYQVTTSQFVHMSSGTSCLKRWLMCLFLLRPQCQASMTPWLSP